MEKLLSIGVIGLALLLNGRKAFGICLTHTPSLENSNIHVLDSSARSLVHPDYSSHLSIDPACHKVAPLLSSLTFINHTLERGFECSTQSGHPIALMNAKKIAALFSNKRRNFKITCSRELPEGATAEAITQSNDPDFPGMKIGKNIDETNSSSTKEWSGRFFHELFHSISYLHGETLEFPYACEACCFDSQADAKTIAKACEICRGKYLSITKNYILDLEPLFNKIGGDELTLDVMPGSMKQYIKAHPHDRWGPIKLASYYSPVLAYAFQENLRSQRNFQFSEGDPALKSSMNSKDTQKLFERFKPLLSKIATMYFNNMPKGTAQAKVALSTEKFPSSKECQKQFPEGENSLHSFMTRHQEVTPVATKGEAFKKYFSPGPELGADLDAPSLNSQCMRLANNLEVFVRETFGDLDRNSNPTNRDASRMLDELIQDFPHR